MSETMSDTDWFGDSAAEDAAIAAQEFEPERPADPQEPATLVDGAGPVDPGEADIADVIAQREPAGQDDDDYERAG